MDSESDRFNIEDGRASQEFLTPTNLGSSVVYLSRAGEYLVASALHGFSMLLKIVISQKQFRIEMD